MSIVVKGVLGLAVVGAGAVYLPSDGLEHGTRVKWQHDSEDKVWIVVGEPLDHLDPLYRIENPRVEDCHWALASELTVIE